MNMIMKRTSKLVVGMGLIVSLPFNAITPAFAQVQNYANCEALAEQRDSTTPSSTFREFMRECMAGRIPTRVPAQTPTPSHVLAAESFGYCQALAEQRGSTMPENTHRAFIRQCMSGQIPGR
jgi:hypothetical protein